MIHWKEPGMSTASEHAGQAALSICEALLLAMNDHGCCRSTRSWGCSATLRQPMRTLSAADEAEEHRAVASLIDAIIAGGNFVRRS
jgi:hypothetical protein